MALALTSCGAPAGGNVAASTQPRIAPPAPPRAPDSADKPPESWAGLVATERIWRRPDLDRLCDAAHAGFFMPKSPAEPTPPPIPAGDIGCAPPAEPAVPGERIIETPQDFLGSPYCCPRSRTAPLPHTAGAPSCEQAVLDYVRRLQGASPSDENPGPFGTVLNHGSYFAHCGVPNSTGIDICAAIVEGHTVGVTVRTTPVSPANAECIADSVLHLTFPSSQRLAVARTSF